MKTKLYNFRDAINGNVICALYDKREMSDKNINIQLLGLDYKCMLKVKSYVLNHKTGKMFIQGWDQHSSSTWIMVEFWTDDKELIENCCNDIVNLANIRKEDVQGWEHPDFNNIF